MIIVLIGSRCLAIISRLLVYFWIFDPLVSWAEDARSIAPSKIPELVLDASRELDVILGKPLSRLPNMETLNQAAFGDRVRRVAVETTGVVGYDRASWIGCFFDPIRYAVVWLENDPTAANASLRVDEMDAFKRIILFHELVHAWQHEYAKEAIQRCREHSDPTVISALLEGHAEWATEQFCRRAGVFTLFERLAKKKPSFPSSANLPDLSFRYVESANFWHKLVAAKRSPELSDVLLNHVPTQRQIAYPDEYLQDFRPLENDLSGFSVMVSSSMPSQPSKGKNTAISFVSLRAYVRTLSVSTEQSDRMLKGYANGSRFGDERRQITVLAFTSTAVAGEVFQHLVKQQELRSNVKVERCVFAETARCGSHRIADAKQDRFITTAVVQDGQFVWELNDYLFESYQLTWPVWLSQLEKTYQIVQPKEAHKP